MFDIYLSVSGVESCVIVKTNASLLRDKGFRKKMYLTNPVALSISMQKNACYNSVKRVSTNVFDLFYLWVISLDVCFGETQAITLISFVFIFCLCVLSSFRQ